MSQKTDISETDLVECIRKYYAAIDQANLDQALSIFATEARYMRGSRVLKNRDEIETFYRQERSLKGQHCISYCSSFANIVVAKGVFSQETVNDEEIAFYDLFEFDKNMKVIQRKTSFVDNQQHEAI